MRRIILKLEKTLFFFSVHFTVDRTFELKEFGPSTPKQLSCAQA